MVVADGVLDAARDYHSARLSAILPKLDHLLMEVVHHDFGLEADRVLVVLDVTSQLRFGLLGIELRVGFHCFDQSVVAVDRGVTLQHVDDEAFLYGLLHRIGMEGSVPDFPSGCG